MLGQTAQQHIYQNKLQSQRHYYNEHRNKHPYHSHPKYGILQHASDARADCRKIFVYSFGKLFEVFCVSERVSAGGNQ